MDLAEAYGSNFVPKKDMKNQRKRIKNLEPTPEPTPQGTSLLPEDVNPRPSSVPRTHVIDQRPRPQAPQILGMGSSKSIGKIVGDSLRNVMGSFESFNPMGTLGSHNMSPEIYLIQFHISKDDCHMICLFIMIFIISFMMSRK